MSDEKKKKRDIMADLLGGDDSEEETPEGQELQELIHRSFKAPKRPAGPTLHELNDMAHRSFRLIFPPGCTRNW